MGAATASDVLTNLGLPGIIILGLTYAVVHLYRDRNKQQQGRLDDAKAVTQTLLQLQHDQLVRDAAQDRLLESIHGMLEAPQPAPVQEGRPRGRPRGG